MERRFAAARALVTGGGTGIGRAIALALAAAGAEVGVAGRRPEKLDEVTTEAGSGVFSVTADLAEEAGIELFATRAIERLDGLDLLVHSAGAFTLGALATTPVSELDRLYLTNVRAPYLLTQRLLDELRASQGQVVFVNSSAGLAPRGRVGAYAASKAALKALADSLRDEENANGVRVLSVYPGRTASPMQEAVIEAEGGTYRPERLLQPEDIATAVLDALALPRTAELTDLQIRPMLKS